MRSFFPLLMVVSGACSLSDTQRSNRGNFDDGAVAPCVTEEVLREANVSEAEIQKFKEEQAAAELNAATSCG